MGDLSPHFSKSEFRCRHCGRVIVERDLVAALETLRRLVGRPIRIVSGYRCATHNANVGGAPRSRHVQGDAADLELGVATVRQAERAGFTGIGYRKRRGRKWAVHVDTRPGGPARWQYG